MYSFTGPIFRILKTTPESIPSEGTMNAILTQQTIKPLTKFLKFYQQSPSLPLPNPLVSSCPLTLSCLSVLASWLSFSLISSFSWTTSCSVCASLSSVSLSGASGSWGADSSSPPSGRGWGTRPSSWGGVERGTMGKEIRWRGKTCHFLSCALGEL